MLGTLNGALEVRGIPMDMDALSARAEGGNEIVDRVIVLTGIHVHYMVRVPEGASREKVDRALETHARKCPTARSLEGAVKVTWSADVDWGESGESADRGAASS